MQKLLVEISSPAVDKTYDVYIPCNLQVGEVIRLAARVFADLSNGTYKRSSCNVLCEKETGRVFDPDLFVKDSGIRNGMKLLLF